MDVKLLADALIDNAPAFVAALCVFMTAGLLLKSRLAKRLWTGIEDTIFSNWQLGTLAATGLVLSLASGYTTWDGMRNFTGEGVLSAMVTFGIQGVMLIVAWLIGESFATGMNTQASAGQSRLVNPQLQIWLGTIIGVVLFGLGTLLLLQWTGATDVRQASSEDLQWSKTGDKFLMFGAGLLLVALFVLYAASDVIKPYIQGSRVIVRNSVLWLMFLACMATSVFFSFDSLFTSIFPQSERVRAAELRAQNQVAGIVSDIEQAIARRRAAEADTLFKSEAWTTYATDLAAIGDAAQRSEGAIERYVNSQIEARRRAVKDQQERMASAQAGQAGLASRKTSLTEEKARLATERPELAAEYAAKKADVDAKGKEVDAKRVEALAEGKGVEGTGREGRGPVYRQRLSELNLLQEARKIAEERLNDAQKRLTAVENRLSNINRELATIDGDLAKLKGEAETAQTRIKLAEETAEDADAPKLDPARILPAFARAVSEFRAGPSAERLASVQKMCSDIHGALSSTPDTKALLTGLDCDPKTTADAAGTLFALQAGTQLFEQTCVGGDKLVANKTADDLFAFTRKCLGDSALPSQETDALRTKINAIELARDDKAHRFVVTWNAFTDGNRLAYLALAIAIAIDSLVFMSGLFGANAVRSPLSDVPSFKARSASQLESTINAALGPHPYETAWLTLQTLRPITNSEGFSASADLSAMENSAAGRVRMVLTAGADIGAVEAISHNPERYRVRGELREYLSTVCDRHFKTDASAKDRARLDQLVNAALAPHPREHADLALHTLEPIRETEGFTSMVTLSKVTDAYENRIVRRVMNAGAAVKAVVPDVKIDDRYYIRPTLYETLLTIRATAAESASYDYDRRRFAGIPERPILDGGTLREDQPRIAQPLRQAELPKPQATQAGQPSQPPPLAKLAPLTGAERQYLVANFRTELLGAIGLTPALADQRLQSEAARISMLNAWKALDNHGKKNDQLGSVLREFQNAQDWKLSEAYSRLRSSAGEDERKQDLLAAVDDKVRDDLALYMLFPETQLVDFLIDEIERAAAPDDGLQPGEQALKNQLVYVRQGLEELNLSDSRSWDEIKQRLASGYKRDLPGNSLNKFSSREQNPGDDDTV